MANQARGYRSEIVMGFEQSYGDVGTSPKGNSVPFVSESLVLARNKNASTVLRGTRNPAAPDDGNTDVTGDVVVPVDVRNFGLWMKGLFGAPTTTQETEGMYKHIFSSGEEMPSLFMQTKIATSTPFYKVSKGVKISSFALQTGGDAELTATLGMMGGRQSKEDTALVAAPTVLASGDVFKNFMAELKVDDVVFGKATAFALNLDNGLDGDTYCIGGKGFRGDLSEGLMGLSGSMDVLLIDTVLYQKAIDSTELKFSLKYSRADGTSLEFAVPHAQIAATGVAVPGPAGLRMTWNWQGYSPLANDAALLVTLINDVTTY